MTFQGEDSNPRFSVIFPPMIWIFMKAEDDKIKSIQASKIYIVDLLGFEVVQGSI